MEWFDGHVAAVGATTSKVDGCAFLRCEWRVWAGGGNGCRGRDCVDTRRWGAVGCSRPGYERGVGGGGGGEHVITDSVSSCGSKVLNLRVIDDHLLPYVMLETLLEALEFLRWVEIGDRGAGQVEAEQVILRSADLAAGGKLNACSHGAVKGGEGGLKGGGEGVPRVGCEGGGCVDTHPILRRPGEALGGGGNALPIRDGGE